MAQNYSELRKYVKLENRFEELFYDLYAHLEEALHTLPGRSDDSRMAIVRAMEMVEILVPEVNPWWD